MSKEYRFPPVVFAAVPGIGTVVSSRTARSFFNSPLFPLPLPFPLSLPLPLPFPFSPLSACPTDRTRTEASNPIPRNLPHRAIGPHRDTSRLLDISSSLLRILFSRYRSQRYLHTI